MKKIKSMEVHAQGRQSRVDIPIDFIRRLKAATYRGHHPEIQLQCAEGDNSPLEIVKRRYRINTGRTMDNNRGLAAKRTSNAYIFWVPPEFVGELQTFTKTTDYRPSTGRVAGIATCLAIIAKDPTFPVRPIYSSLSQRRRRLNRAVASIPEVLSFIKDPEAFAIDYHRPNGPHVRNRK